MKRTDKVHNLLNVCKRWTSDRVNQKLFFTQPRQRLESALKQPESISLNDVERLTPWYGNQLVVNISNGTCEGGSDLASFAEAQWLYFRYGSSRPLFYTFCGCALLHLGLNSREKASWLFDRINENHESHRFYDVNYDYKMEYPYEFYCKALWDLMRGCEPSREETEKCGEFSGVLRTWNDPEILASEVWELCEYHLSHSGEPKGYDIYEFNHSPFTLLPVEILALRTVREHLGLPMPDVDHPLLMTPLMKNLPLELPPVNDELLDKLKEVLKETYPANSAIGAMNTVFETPPEPPVFATEELTEKAGLFRRKYGLIVTLRFTEGETLDSNWPRLLAAIADWRKKRGNAGEMLTVTFQSDPAAHPELYGQFTAHTQADPELDAWIEDLQDYTLSFQQLDGTECRDLVWEKQPDGRNLFTEMKFTPME